MEFKMTNVDKKKLWEESRIDKEEHVFRVAIAAGVDPDTLTLDYDPAADGIGEELAEKLTTALQDLAYVIDKLTQLEQ